MNEQLIKIVAPIIKEFENKHNIHIKIIPKTRIKGNNFGLEVKLSTSEFELLDNDLCSLFKNVDIYYRTRVQVQPNDNNIITTTYIYSYE